MFTKLLSFMTSTAIVCSVGYSTTYYMHYPDQSGNATTWDTNLTTLGNAAGDTVATDEGNGTDASFTSDNQTTYAAQRNVYLDFSTIGSANIGSQGQTIDLQHHRLTLNTKANSTYTFDAALTNCSFSITGSGSVSLAQPSTFTDLGITDAQVTDASGYLLLNNHNLSLFGNAIFAPSATSAVSCNDFYAGRDTPTYVVTFDGTHASTISSGSAYFTNLSIQLALATGVYAANTYGPYTIISGRYLTPPDPLVATLNTTGLLKSDNTVPVLDTDIVLTLAQDGNNLNLTIQINDTLYSNTPPPSTAAWTVNGNDTATIAGPITAYPLIKNGSGVGILNPAAGSSILGVNIEAGTLKIEGSHTSAITGTITASSGTTFQVANGLNLPNAVIFQ